MACLHGSKTGSNTDRHADVDRQQSRDGTKGIGNSMRRMKSMSNEHGKEDDDCFVQCSKEWKAKIR